MGLLDQGFARTAIARDFKMVDDKIVIALIVGAPLAFLILVALAVVGCTWLRQRPCRARVREGYEPIEDGWPYAWPPTERRNRKLITVASLFHVK